MSNSGQIPLSLPLEPNLSRENLLESPSNQLAIDMVDRWPDWPSNMVVLAGPIGSGKSHLAKIWAQRANASIQQISDLKGGPHAREGSNLILEDAAPNAIDEEALFHTINRIRGAGNFLLITSRIFPAAWQIKLPDLVSRLKLAHLVELQEPDDELLSGIIFKLFADRQLEVSVSMVSYLVVRMERSMETAVQLVDWIDREALAKNRKITRSLAADALEALGQV